MVGLNRIVVGVDLGERSLELARWVAARLAPDAELLLIYVVEPPPLSIFYRGVLHARDKMVEDAVKPAREKLAEFAAKLDGERVGTEVRVGRPAERIAAAAEEAGADIIVIGKHRRRGTWVELGSTAEELFHFARVPVLLSHGLPEHIGAILMPVEENDLTPLVFAWTRFLADRYGARVIALHVLSQLLHGHLRLVSTREKAERAEASAKEVARSHIEALLRQAGFDMEKTAVEVALGHADQEILVALERRGADAVVMGSHGAGELARAVIGSAASSVARRAACPVLVVRGP